LFKKRLDIVLTFAYICQCKAFLKLNGGIKMCQNKIKENIKIAAEAFAEICQSGKLSWNSLSTANDLYRRIREFENKIIKECEEKANFCKPEEYNWAKEHNDIDYSREDAKREQQERDGY